MSTAPLRYAALIAMATGLAACNDSGGGGGGDSTPEPDDNFTSKVPEGDAEVSESNANAVTDSSLRSANTIIGQGSSGSVGTPDTKSPSDMASEDSLIGSVHRFVEAAQEGGSGPTTRATSVALGCESGSGTVAYTSPDNGDRYSQDAKWSLDFDSCVMTDGNRYDGSFTLTFTKDYATSGDNWEAGWELEYDDYSAHDDASDDLIWRAHGDMGLTFGEIGGDKTDGQFEQPGASSYYIVSGESFYVAYDDEVAHNQDYRLEYRISQYNDFLFSYDAQVATTETGGWITVETTDTTDKDANTDNDKFEWNPSSGLYPFNGDLYIAGGQTPDPANEPTNVHLYAVTSDHAPEYVVTSDGVKGNAQTFDNWNNLLSGL